MKLSQDQFDKLALEQLDTVYRVAQRLARDPARAEDLVQETYLRALRSRDGFDLQEFGIRPWLLRILQNLYVSRGAREQRQPRSVDSDKLDSIQSDGNRSGPLPIDPASYDAMDEQLVSALEQLPEEYQVVMLLWAVEDLSYKEISVALDVPIGTVMSRLFRAHQRLSEELRDYASQNGLIRK